jgi:hypothetical protein
MVSAVCVVNVKVSVRVNPMLATGHVIVIVCSMAVVHQGAKVDAGLMTGEKQKQYEQQMRNVHNHVAAFKTVVATP